MHMYYDRIKSMKNIFSKKKAMEGGEEMGRLGLIADGAIAEAPVGYYTSKYEYPLCNHTEEVTEKNIGYAQGITAGGVPFEAELYEEAENMSMAVIMPAIFNDANDGEENEKSFDSHSNITNMHYQVKFLDYSVLDIGMVDDAIEENLEVVKLYVNFLASSGIVIFDSDVLNGAVFYRVDALGNDLVKILITLREGEDFWAYTNLDIKEFPKKRKSLRNTTFKVIK